MVFRATERAGWLPDDDSTYQKTSHVGFGLVLVEDSKMLLEVVRLVDLLVAAMSRIKDALIEQGIDKEWTEEVLEHTAEAVGYGAVKSSEGKFTNSEVTGFQRQN
ncbi:arginine--tRNA ligase, cytoplasmic-like [Tripterygium wilfordii]|uniref:arginine--tRNA ligase, cytoplasmic-like n=1 Tax=Tripterygium wilfordii TaxID=458696 RepID=UPI0018F81D23|nr:arginine--tRNA ligase, cytoplasmic-like [Tripterygium wilfordii]